MAVNKLETSQDFRDELKDIENRKVRLNSYLQKRLLDLAQAHPNAIIDIRPDCNITAKAINKDMINNLLDVSAMIKYVEMIEAHIENQSIQLKLF